MDSVLYCICALWVICCGQSWCPGRLAFEWYIYFSIRFSHPFAHFRLLSSVRRLDSCHQSFCPCKLYSPVAISLSLQCVPSECTVGQNSQEPRHKYWATCLSLCLHRSLICLLRPACFARKLRSTHSFAHLLTSSLMGQCFIKWLFFCFFLFWTIVEWRRSFFPFISNARSGLSMNTIRLHCLSFLLCDRLS